MLSVLWIGLTSTDEMFEDMVKKGYFHAPTFVAQKSIIQGIEANINCAVHSINGFMMPSIPRCTEVISKKATWSHRIGAEDIGVASVNIKYIDVFVREILMGIEGRKWGKNHRNEDVIVLVYTASYPYLYTAFQVKKHIPDAKIYLIVPDLPEYMELKPSKLKRFLKRLDRKRLYTAIHKCDGYILFTKHMADYLDIIDKPWMVMEGSINIEDCRAIEQKLLQHSNDYENSKIVIMYSGAIDIKYGVPELLDAFSEIDSENYELWFTGIGNAKGLIEERAKEDSRIKYYGFLPSREEVLCYQQQATMLINTRMPTEVASAYCFPSKIFEYLLSGKPVLTFKIPGIPDEYYDYLISMDEPTPECIKDAIIGVSRMSVKERQSLGKKGKKFVLEKKNNIVQAKKICRFADLL
jgi:glycosyltransferase involved in cell wall biosynthesis